MSPRRHRSQSGFALLLVFAMAAIVGIMLFLELPRVAFEAQRVREEVLIQRGEQYQRAIKLFFRKFQRYPPTLEALENTNNMRFLRRRYKDPMTGKDEWRLIHAGPGGILTDSLTQKPPQKTDDKQITSLESMSATTTETTVVSMVPRRRQSDSTQLPTPGTDLQSGQLNPPPLEQVEQPSQPEPGQIDPTTGQPIQPGQPGLPGQPGQQYPPPAPGQVGQPGQPGTYPPSFPGQPGYQPPAPGYQPNPAGMGVAPGFQPGGVPGPGQFPPSNISLSGPGQPPTTPPPYRSSSLGPTGSGPGSTPVPDMIQTILTQPGQRPGALGGRTTIGGGIVGVASTLEAEGIKSFNDHTKYNEWEFIYDPRKDISMQMMGMQPGGLPPQNVPGPGSSMFTPTNPSSTTRR